MSGLFFFPHLNITSFSANSLTCLHLSCSSLVSHWVTIGEKHKTNDGTAKLNACVSLGWPEKNPKKQPSCNSLVQLAVISHHQTSHHLASMHTSLKSCLIGEVIQCAVVNAKISSIINSILHFHGVD